MFPTTRSFHSIVSPIGFVCFAHCTALHCTFLGRSGSVRFGTGDGVRGVRDALHERATNDARGHAAAGRVRGKGRGGAPARDRGSGRRSRVVSCCCCRGPERGGVEEQLRAVEREGVSRVHRRDELLQREEATVHVRKNLACVRAYECMGAYECKRACIYEYVCASVHMHPDVA